MSVQELKKLDSRVENLANVFRKAEENHTLQRNTATSKLFFDLWREYTSNRKEEREMLGQLADLRKSLQIGFDQYCDIQMRLLRVHCKKTRKFLELHRT